MNRVRNNNERGWRQEQLKMDPVLWKKPETNLNTFKKNIFFAETTHMRHCSQKTRKSTKDSRQYSETLVTMLLPDS
jgi:hypothetical protein